VKFYTADPHFAHRNIIRHCDRPFATVEEMDAVLIENWNRRVGPEDEVYMLGDFLFFAGDPADYIRQLAGKKYLILGNHDETWIKKMEKRGTAWRDWFEDVQLMMEITDGDRKLVLCHYPMMTWNGVGEGSTLLYGHIHNNTKDTYWPLLRQMDNALNAGVDINGFQPVTLAELERNNAAFRASH
jgi:calcineurin-like phosphoesterase family protein